MVNTKFQQDEISKVLEVTEKVELYLKEMLFIVEHGSDKQAFLLCRKIDKYLHQADNDLQTTIICNNHTCNNSSCYFYTILKLKR
jgi:hypothetical protein